MFLLHIYVQYALLLILLFLMRLVVVRFSHTDFAVIVYVIVLGLFSHFLRIFSNLFVTLSWTLACFVIEPLLLDTLDL